MSRKFLVAIDFRSAVELTRFEFDRFRVRLPGTLLRFHWLLLSTTRLASLTVFKLFGCGKRLIELVKSEIPVTLLKGCQSKTLLQQQLQASVFPSHSSSYLS